MAETHSRERWCAGLMIVLLSAAAPVIARAQLGSDLDGTYLFAGGDAERAALGRALDRAASQLNIFVRPAGSRMLRRTLTVPSEVVVETMGDELAIAIHPYPLRRSKLDGTALIFRNARSDHNVLRRTMKGRAVVETVVSGTITRQIIYRFDEGNHRLTMSWRVAIPEYLARPILFELRYEREGRFAIAR